MCLSTQKNGGYDVRLIIRGAGQKANYGVREIMVLSDGVPMTDPDSFSRFDYFDTQDEERIEIIKGPGSLYGAENFNLRLAGDVDDANAVAVTASHKALDASTATNFEIGLKGRTGLWSFDTSVYYTSVEDEIVPTLLDGQTRFQNAGRTEKQGFEVSGHYQLLEGLSLGGSCAFSDYEYDEFINAGNDYSGNQMPYVPCHQYSHFADYRHPGGFKARLQKNSWESYYMDAANTEKYADYDFVTDLSMGDESGPHTFSLNVQNLFDKHYATEVKKDTRGNKYYSAASPLAAMLNYSFAF